jgi:hypothetical protein
MKILIFCIVLFLSYVQGRLGHIYLGENNGLHHWILGVIFIIIGIIFKDKWWGGYLIAIGVGQVISDFLDMIHLKVWGRDPKGPKRFWHID